MISCLYLDDSKIRIIPSLNTISSACLCACRWVSINLSVSLVHTDWLTRSKLGDCTQQVVVDAGRSVLALAPAHRRRGRRRDQKLFGGLGRGQVRLVDVLTPTLDLWERRGTLIKAVVLLRGGQGDSKWVKAVQFLCEEYFMFLVMCIHFKVQGSRFKAFIVICT